MRLLWYSWELSGLVIRTYICTTLTGLLSATTLTAIQ